MPTVELLMPKLGESIIEATILSWNKKVGDSVAIDEPVLEIATDKVDSEVPSEVEGTIVEILFNEGDVVPVGKAVAIIDIGGDVDIPEKTNVVPEPAIVVQQIQEQLDKAQETVSVNNLSNANGFRFYSPLVMNIAKEEKVSMIELDAIIGSGKEGRVTKDDIKAYLESRASKPVESNAQVKIEVKPDQTIVAQKLVKPTENKESVAPVKSYSGNVEVIEMDRMRKMIAKHMTETTHTAAHVTTFVEADVTNIVHWRNKMKDEFLKKEGEKITFTPIFMEAVAKALKEFPYVNASIDGENIILKKDINLGMATALPSGNLIVPVIKNIDHLNIVGITKRVNDLANRARNNKLKPDETTDGTYTLTNVGSFGNVMGTPLINQPQVGILAVGSIQKKPVVLETPEGDVIGIRHMMFLSHSYDHRLVDGAMGGQFVRRVADLLETFDVNRTI